MKYYLSSFKIGNESEKLRKLSNSVGKPFGYVPNALDFTGADSEKWNSHIKSDMDDFSKTTGKEIEVLDLKKYFGSKEKLQEKISELGGLYVSGGNSFVLRQAMQISGIDEILIDTQERDDFLYCAYSAGVCVLTPTMRPYAITDDAEDFPYSEVTEQIWRGLGILDFVFQPHYDSDHAESASTDKEIKYCIDNKILFKAFKDGEVLVIE